MMLATYFRMQADTCVRLAQNCFDLGTARELRELSSEFRHKAAEIDAQAARTGVVPNIDGDGLEREH